MEAARTRRPWTAAFLGFCLLMAFKAFYVLVMGGVVSESQTTELTTNRNNLVYVALWLVLYGASGLILIAEAWRRGIDRRLLLMAPLGLYAVASATWSQVPAVSAVPATMLTLDMVIAAALASTIHPARLLRAIAALNIGLVLASLALLALVPGMVISDPTRHGILMPGQLVGAYDTKASLAMAAGIGIVVILFLPWLEDRPFRRYAALAVLGLGVVLANAAGPMMATLLAVGLLTGARIFPRLASLILGAGFGVVLLWSISLPFIDIGGLAAMVGRTADLTGRGTFWPLAPHYLMERPFLGWGFLAFFDDGPYSKAWEIWARELYFFTPEFHNSLLDIAIGLGLVGAAGYVALLAGTGIGLIRHPALDRRCAEVMAAILVMLTLSSATEFLLLSHNSFATIFLFYAFLVGGRRYRAVPSPVSAPAAAPGRVRIRAGDGAPATP